MNYMSDMNQMLNWPLLYNAKKIGLNLFSDIDQKAMIIGGWAVRTINPILPANMSHLLTENIQKKAGYSVLFLGGAVAIKIIDTIVGKRRPPGWADPLKELKEQIPDLLQNSLLSYRITSIEDRSTWRQYEFRFHLQSESFTYIPLVVKIKFYNDDYRIPHLVWSLILSQVERQTYIEITASRDTIIPKRLYHRKSEYEHEHGDIQRIVQQMWWDIEPKIRRHPISQ